MAWENWDEVLILFQSRAWTDKHPDQVFDFIQDALQKVKALESEIEDLREALVMATTRRM